MALALSEETLDALVLLACLVSSVVLDLLTGRKNSATARIVRRVLRRKRPQHRSVGQGPSLLLPVLSLAALLSQGCFESFVPAVELASKYHAGALAALESAKSEDQRAAGEACRAAAFALAKEARRAQHALADGTLSPEDRRRVTSARSRCEAICRAAGISPKPPAAADLAPDRASGPSAADLAPTAPADGAVDGGVG